MSPMTGRYQIFIESFLGIHITRGHFWFDSFSLSVFKCEVLFLLKRLPPDVFSYVVSRCRQH